MGSLRAGFGKIDITPRVGARLVGYAGREQGSTGVHDRLFARALVLENEGRAWALCALDLCYFREPSVAAVREIVGGQTHIPGDHVFICTTHTHSGPDDADTDSYPTPLPELVAEAIIQAASQLRPAALAVGYGVLYGHSINRRWIHRPIDPAVTVIRVDDDDGCPLGLVTNFGLHGVVLGADNLLISADWPGYAMAALERALGEEAVCLFTQGGSADANPLTRRVQERLRSGRPVRAIGHVSTYYGPDDSSDAWNIGDRRGGTFEEAAVIGEAFADEALRVAHGLRPQRVDGPLWVERVVVNVAAAPDERGERREAILSVELPWVPNRDGERPLEIMAVGIEGPSGILILGQPGEIFAETAMELRRALETMGYHCPMIVGYANGWQLYLPPASAFPEGGYEVDWARYMGFSPDLQQRIWESIRPRLAAHAPGGDRG